MYDIAIIGGGPAGLTAALYARRQNKNVIIFEKNAFGGQTLFSPKIENYPGFNVMSGMEFSDKLVEQVINQGGEFALEEVLSVEKCEDHWSLKTDYGEYTALSIIIATGAKHRLLGVEREEHFIGRGVSFCAICDGAFYKDKDVIMVGGGNSALVESNLLVDTCRSLTIVQNLSFLTGDIKLRESILSHDNVNVIYDSVVESFIGDDEYKGIIIKNTLTGELKELYSDGLFIAIGLLPDTEIFKDLVRIDGGYIISDEKCFTDIDGVFAAGDCRTKSVRQITTACADGANAAINACNYVDAFSK